MQVLKGGIKQLCKLLIYIKFGNTCILFVFEYTIKLVLFLYNFFVISELMLICHAFQDN